MSSKVPKLLGLLGLVGGLATGARAQEATPGEESATPDYTVEFLAEPVAERSDLRTFRVAVHSTRPEATELDYRFELTRASGTNRSTSSQGGRLAVGANATDTIGQSTINVAPGDLVLARVTLSREGEAWELSEEEEMTF